MSDKQLRVFDIGTPWGVFDVMSSYFTRQKETPSTITFIYYNNHIDDIRYGVDMNMTLNEFIAAHPGQEITRVLPGRIEVGRYFDAVVVA